MQPLILIVGPTGSGKSALALGLAQELGAAVMNCDSLQTYQRLDIGTAKPSPHERSLVPHFLFDVLPPGAVLTAGDFRRLALDVLRDELPRRVVCGVGGSGFYIQALEKGMFDVPKADPGIDQRVHEECLRLGLPAMFERLNKLDPEYAEKISPNDSYRIVRALVILADSGQRVSDLRRAFQAIPFPYPLLKLGLAPTREQLLPRIEARTQSMLEQGLVEEVRTLVTEGFASWPALASVGYKECVQFLKGELGLGQLQARIVEKTMQLAKKQRTWFKRDADIRWLPVEDPLPAGRNIVAQFLDSAR